MFVYCLLFKFNKNTVQLTLNNMNIMTAIADTLLLMHVVQEMFEV